MSYMLCNSLTACGRRCGLPGHQVQGGWGLSVCLYSTYVVYIATLPSQNRDGFGCLAQTALSQWGCCLD